MEVGRGLELLDGGFALFIELLDEFAGGAAVEEFGGGFIRGQFLRQLRGAGGEFVEQVYLLDEATRCIRQRVEGLSRGVLSFVGLL